MIPSLASRAPGPERMDVAGALDPEALRCAYGELDLVNRRLGGHAATRRGLDDLDRRADLAAAAARAPIEILDAGGGSGAAALEILAWARDRGIAARVIVLESDPVAADLAARRLEGRSDAEVRRGDLRDLPAACADVVHAGLVLHHFDGPEAGRALAALARAARLGVVVNDLERGRVPWVLIHLLCRMILRSPIVRHDAPLSVARGFVEAEWPALGEAAGLELAWRRAWAWRWVVTGIPRRS